MTLPTPVSRAQSGNRGRANLDSRPEDQRQGRQLFGLVRPWHCLSEMKQHSRDIKLLGRKVCDLAEAVPQGISLPVTRSRGDFGAYPDAQGASELRQRIAERENAKYGLHLTAHNIVVTNGAAEALFLVVHAFVKPGDTVLVQVPSIYLYRDIIENHGGLVYHRLFAVPALLHLDPFRGPFRCSGLSNLAGSNQGVKVTSKHVRTWTRFKRGPIPF
jgi:Aminotransferase class I and II